MLNKTFGECYLVAEIGINHNGDLGIAKKLISLAHEVGFDCVKFQKRTVPLVYTDDELAKPRQSPFGTTNRELKFGLEFNTEQYKEIDRYCRALGIDWTASPWDTVSVDFLSQFDLPYIKVASACITDRELLRAVVSTGKPIAISTGMSDLSTIVAAVNTIEKAGGNVSLIYHCNSTYPCPVGNINLYGLDTLDAQFPNIKIGYSGHETGVVTSVMAAVLGAYSVERHVTLNRAMFGSDQAASLEPEGMRRLVRDIRTWERARGDGRIRVYEEEKPIAAKLRRVNDL